MIGAVCSWAACTLIGRVALKGLGPLAATACAARWGWLFLALSAAGGMTTVDWLRLEWKSRAAIGYLGAFGTVIAFVWYDEGVKAIGASRTVIFNNPVPVCGAALATLLLGEPILASLIKCPHPR